MRQWLALLIVVAGAGCIAAAVSPARAPVFGTQDAYAKTCHVGYVQANFPWGERCIRAGQYCKKAHNLEYADYGFQCINGKLRLGKPCPPSGKVNVHWHYSANGSAGGWTATRPTSCTNGSVSIAQATEGDLKLNPGTPLKTGYSFSLP